MFVPLIFLSQESFTLSSNDYSHSVNDEMMIGMSGNRPNESIVSHGKHNIQSPC